MQFVLQTRDFGSRERPARVSCCSAATVRRLALVSGTLLVSDRHHDGKCIIEASANDQIQLKFRQMVRISA